VRTVVEFKLFSRIAEGRLSEAARKALTDLLAVEPDAGDLIPGGGGARKLRWAASGHGKSGGARIITYWHCDGCPVYLITMYLKADRSDLSQAEIAWLYNTSKDLSHANQVDQGS